MLCPVNNLQYRVFLQVFLDMSIGRPKTSLELTAGEREELSGFAASRSLSHALVSRAKLVLWLATYSYPTRNPGS